MKSILTILIVCSGYSLVAQLKQKAADQHFARKEYAKCVTMYDELASKCFKESKKGDWENVRKAAQCHYFLFEMSEALEYFEKLQNKNMLLEADRVQYIHALRFNERYEKSSALIRESASLFPNNTYFSRMFENEIQFNGLFADSSFYKIRQSEINSGQGDFGTAFFDSSIVYVTKSQNTGFVNPTFGYDGDFYLNILKSSIEPDSTLLEPELLKHNFLSRAHDGPVSFSKDGKTMVITRNMIGKKNGREFIVLSLYFSTFNNGEWSELIPFEFNNESYNVGHGVFSENGAKLYFVSDKPGGFGESDIYVCEKTGNKWGEPRNLGKSVNTERNEMFPFVQGDQLYFASDGHYGLGGLDLFEIGTDYSGKAHNIGYPVNTSHDDFALIFDESGKIGFLSSNRGDNVDRIYHVEKRPIKVIIEGDVYAKYAENETIANQKIWFKNMTNQLLDSMITNENGHFSIPAKINQEYRIYTQKDEFILQNEAKVSTANVKRDTTIFCELILKPTTIIVHLRVVEKVTGKIIPEAHTSITDYDIPWDTTMVTNTEGMVSLVVERYKVYWTHGAKKGYIDADVSFNSSNENDKVIELQLELPPIKKGEKFKLENIFYDLNKSTLRPESMVALDKLADFIIKNNLKIELSAHTDSRGSNTYNQKLSQARAQSCVDYLIKKGVDPSSIKAKGYGETQLMNRCKDGVTCTEEEHQVNRRTEVKILEVH